MIAVAHAIVEPYAMVVHPTYAESTFGTVLCSDSNKGEIHRWEKDDDQPRKRLFRLNGQALDFPFVSQVRFNGDLICTDTQCARNVKAMRLQHDQVFIRHRWIQIRRAVQL